MSTYRKLDIALLYVPPYLRGVAIDVLSQMPAPGVLAYLRRWVRGLGQLIKGRC